MTLLPNSSFGLAPWDFLFWKTSTQGLPGVYREIIRIDCRSLGQTMQHASGPGTPLRVREPPILSAGLHESTVKPFPLSIQATMTVRKSTDHEADNIRCHAQRHARAMMLFSVVTVRSEALHISCMLHLISGMLFVRHDVCICLVIMLHICQCSELTYRLIHHISFLFDIR